MKGINLHKVLLKLKWNAPTILTVVGSFGVIATAVTAVKATPKVMRLLDHAKEEKSEELTKKETVLIAAPAYLPSIGIGVSTIACIFGANILNKKTQASLASAYALANNTYKEYRAKLIELYGQEADDNIRKELYRTNCAYHQLGSDDPDDEKLVWFEPITKQTKRAYEREIMDAEYHINRNFALAGCACLNDYLEFLGFEQVEEGDVIGWSMSEGYSWIDFQHRLVDNPDGSYYYVIDAIFPPDDCFMEDWI